MTLPEADSEFETFLKRRTVLPNGMSDDDKLEPPKALDAIVLRKAHEAIREQERLNRAPRWARPVALAATILLCLSIVLNVSLNVNRPAASLRPMTATTANEVLPTPAGPANEEERGGKLAGGATSGEAILPEAKVAGSAAPQPPLLAEAAKPAPGESLQANDYSADKADVLANRRQAPSEAKPSARSDVGITAQLAERSGTLARAPEQAAAAPASSAPDKAAKLADRGGTPARSSDEAVATADSSAEARLSEVVTTAVRATGKAARHANQSGAPAPSAAGGVASSPSYARAAASPPSTPGVAPTDQSFDGVAVTAQRVQPAHAKAKAEAASPHPRDPKTWLEQIAALRAEGKTAEADAEMQRFRAVFPAYPPKADPSAPTEPPK